MEAEHDKPCVTDAAYHGHSFCILGRRNQPRRAACMRAPGANAVGRLGTL